MTIADCVPLLRGARRRNPDGGPAPPCPFLVHVAAPRRPEVALLANSLARAPFTTCCEYVTYGDGAQRPHVALALLLRGSNIPRLRTDAMATRSKDRPSPPAGLAVETSDTAALLRELVAHLRQNRTQLREEWARRITRAQLLTAMTEAEIFAEATSVYDNYVEALETGTFEALQAYSRNLSERIIPRGVETHEVVGIVLLLRDVLARSLFAKYHEA